MPQHRNFRQASRRFEMMVHDGVPETPQPMYQESTYGKTPSRLTGQASDAPGAKSPGGTVAAVFLLREEMIVSEPPSNSDEEAT
jgi:hypothetical protein